MPGRAPTGLYFLMILTPAAVANNNTLAITNGISGAGVSQTAVAVGMRHAF